MVKNAPANAGDTGLIAGLGRDPLEQHTPVFLPRKFQGQKSLVGYSRKELDMNEELNNYC